MFICICYSPANGAWTYVAFAFCRPFAAFQLTVFPRFTIRPAV